jgi:hypothetical protein
MDRMKALLIIHARMLGTSLRRIAEIFGEDSKQSTGQNLVEQAAAVMGVDLVEMESDSFENRLNSLHLKLGIYTDEEGDSHVLLFAPHGIK